MRIQQKKELEQLKKENLEQYAVKGSEAEWSSALSGKQSKNLISVKTGEKRPTEDDSKQENLQKYKKKRKKFPSNT